MTTEKLRDCPFCGSKDVMKSLGVGLKWTVGCNNCGCRTKECTHSIDAVTSWNRRADDPAEEFDIEGCRERAQEFADNLAASMPGMFALKDVPF